MYIGIKHVFCISLYFLYHIMVQREHVCAKVHAVQNTSWAVGIVVFSWFKVFEDVGIRHVPAATKHQAKVLLHNCRFPLASFSCSSHRQSPQTPSPDSE